MHRIYQLPFGQVYELYVAKLERKGRSEEDLNQAIFWLTGYSEAELAAHLEAGTNFRDFFAAANLNPLAKNITGKICGVQIEEIQEPLMQQIRQLDKLVDELAKGKAFEKIIDRLKLSV